MVIRDFRENEIVCISYVDYVSLTRRNRHEANLSNTPHAASDSSLPKCALRASYLSEKEDHTSRRAALCVELTADVRQYLTETDVQLRVMYEEHHDDVTATAMLGACIDIVGMDALYAEACCGYDG